MFSFRNKLTLIFSALIIVILLGCFWIVQNNITEAYTRRIKKALKNTEFAISQRMQLRKERLEDFAGMLEVNSLIQVMLRDPSLDRITRDDIITDEIATNFPALKYVLLLDGSGNVLAGSPLAAESEKAIAASAVFKETAAGREGGSHVFYRGDVLQLIGRPIFDGEVLTGAIIVGYAIDDAFLKEIKDGFDADIVIVNGSAVVKHSFWIDHPAAKREELVADFNRALADPAVREMNKEPAQLVSHGEQLIYFFGQHPDPFVPEFVLAKSLDKELEFVDRIRVHIFAVGAAAVALGLAVCYMLSTHVTRPIKELQKATREVHNENYAHRVDVRTRDEFSALGKSFNTMIESIAEKEKIRGVLNKSVSREIAEELLRENLQLGGEKKNATILFVDIRGFTALAEKMDPKDLLSLINTLFTLISQCVDEHKGVIDKYMGDAVMALFGVPLALPNDAQAAVDAAVGIIGKVEAFNADAGNPHKVSLGIGINTGEVVAGNMGAEHRLNYTVMGDEVNLASRIEGLTKMYSVPLIVTDSTRRQAADNGRYLYRPLNAVRVKGKEQSVVIYDVLKNEGEATAVFIKQFAEMADDMHRRDFARAAEKAQRLAGQRPADDPAKLYAQRAAGYLKDPAAYDRDYRDRAFLFHNK